MKEQSNWHEFIANCHALLTPNDLEKFFELVLTPSEREKIAARYQILYELNCNNLTQREIAAKLGVSIFNVTRGANQLKLVSEDSKNLISKNKS